MNENPVCFCLIYFRPQSNFGRHGEAVFHLPVKHSILHPHLSIIRQIMISSEISTVTQYIRDSKDDDMLKNIQNN